MENSDNLHGKILQNLSPFCKNLAKIPARMELSETLKQVYESLPLEKFWRIKNETDVFFSENVVRKNFQLL